jgi:uncharacterized membrane protein
MTLLALLITSGLLWLNLVGLGLLLNYAVRDYAVSRICAPVALCLCLFFLEHFYGLGGRLALFPASTALSAWLAWRHRALLAGNAGLEGAFALGFAYCMAWRYAFPDIDLSGEKIPDLVFITNYISGPQLPPLDRWLPPFRFDFYYSFQHYSAALLGRWFHLGASYSYSYAYCVIVGLITAAAYGAAGRLCGWRPARWLIVAALLAGGCGLGLFVHLSMRNGVLPEETCRYLGLHFAAADRTALGRFLDARMYPPGTTSPELPILPLSFVIAEGEFHPPLAGFLILALGALLIATLEEEPDPRRRGALAALLAATVPLMLLSNTWVFPLQAAAVGGWFAYRAACGERRLGIPGLIGAGVATALAYPFLAGFMHQPLAHSAQLEFTRPGSHSWLGWAMVFWPLLGLAALGLLNRERRGLVIYLACLWTLLMVGTEVFYVHDVKAGTLERYNSTLKWWSWIYAGGILTLGAANLASRSRLCRYGSFAMILVPCFQVYDYGRFFIVEPKPSAGHMEGSHWLTRDATLGYMIRTLSERPDGICLESNITLENTEASVIGVFANKQALVGWPTQENIWRAGQTEIEQRMGEVNDFYADKMRDPLAWLLQNNVRYVLWLQRDNDNQNCRFAPLWRKIGSRYTWRHFYGNDGDWAVGFWERGD